MALVATGLTYEYAKGTSLAHRALDGVSLSVEGGESLLLIGSTGSGKSTLLHLCAGLVEPDVGSVVCDGGLVTIGDVGMVFQKPEDQLFADTVLDDVAFGARNRGCDDEEALACARDALEQVGIHGEDLLARSPFLLSGGQARRVAIAGVLAMKPRYLLLDEPAAGLDASGRILLNSLLADLKAQGCGIIIVSHDIDEFLGMVDHVCLLDEGSLVWSGEAAQIIAQPELFGKAHLALPDLLTFQQLLGGNYETFSFDLEQIANWALGVGGLEAHAEAASGGSTEDGPQDSSQDAVGEA